MPYELKVDPGNGADLQIRVWGQLTAEDMSAAGEEMLSLLRPEVRVLIDASELANSAECLTTFIKAPWREGLPSDMVFASVVPESAAAVSRSWVRVASVNGTRAQAFRSLLAALEWLRGDYQSWTRGS